MLKNTVDLIYNIERFTVDAKSKAIDVEISTGILVDGEFISDGRSLIKHSITNVPATAEQQVGDTIYPEILRRDWFNEASLFVADSKSEYNGMTDYQYNKIRLWSILLEMGLVSGDII